MSTYSAKSHEINREWFIIDAKGKNLGRLSTEVAKLLQGKHKPIYTPHVDTGDGVVIINAEEIAVTGKKESDKLYFRHTGYPGGIKSTSLGQMRAAHPARVLEIAVRGMLPKGPLGREMFRKLKIYAGAKHPHDAQAPKEYSF